MLKDIIQVAKSNTQKLGNDRIKDASTIMQTSPT